MGSALLLETVLGWHAVTFFKKNERHEYTVDRLTPRRSQDSAWMELVGKAQDVMAD
jgi:hypothetical protein